MGTQKDRLAELRNKRNSQARGEPADWSAVDGKLIANAIGWAGAIGGALRFGYTRDGGAFAIGIYRGETHHTEYVRPSEDIERYLRELAEDLELAYRADKREQK